MAVLSPATVFGSGVDVTLNRTTIADADTFVYQAGADQYLIVANNSGGTLAFTIAGSAPVAFSVAGYGTVTPVSKTFSLTTNTTRMVKLDDIAKYLVGSGTVTFSSVGAGLIASLIQ